VRQTLHIFLKDLRGSRKWIVGWFALLMIGSWLAMRDPMEYDRWSVNNWFDLLTVLTAILGACWIVQQDRLVGTDSFWMTRPIYRRALLAAKALFIAAIFAVPPMLLQAAVLWRFGLEAERWGWAIVEMAVYWIAALSATVAMAAVTRSLGGFLVGGIAVFFSLMVLGGLAVDLLAGSLAGSLIGSEARHARNLTAALAGSLLLFGVFARQVLQPLAGRSRHALAAALIVCCALSVAPTGNWIRPLEPLVEEKVAIRLEGHGDEGFSAERRRPEEFSMWGYFSEIQPAAEQTVEVLAFEGTLGCGDSEAGLLAQDSSAPLLDARQYSRNARWALGRGPMPSTQSLSIRAIKGDIDGFFGPPCTLNGTADIRVWKQRPVGFLPLEQSARLDVRSYSARIERVEQTEELLQVTLKQRYFQSRPMALRAPVLALANRDRGEWIPAERLHGDVWAGMSLIDGMGVTVAEETWVFPYKGGGGEDAPAIDRAWLDEAELVVLEHVPAGRSTSEVTMENVQLKDTTYRRVGLVTQNQ